LKEFALRVVICNLFQMMLRNFAAVEILMVEMTHGVFVFCDHVEKFFLGDINEFSDLAYALLGFAIFNT
jgi:hypothetical protein